MSMFMKTSPFANRQAHGVRKSGQGHVKNKLQDKPDVDYLTPAILIGAAAYAIGVFDDDCDDED